jgi:transcriptional regulator with XRE-family HTH domain
MMPLLGSLLRHWRKRAALNQTALADALGTSQQTVSLWERGGDIPPSRWPRLAKALRLSGEETELLKRALIERYALLEGNVHEEA